MTSQALTFVKDVLLQHFGSPGMLLTARCFLEGLALKRLYQKGEISDLQIELLRKQVHLIEYNYYKNFHDIADIILIPEKLSKDKDDVVVFFREKLSDNYTDEDITNILKAIYLFYVKDMLSIVKWWQKPWVRIMQNFMDCIAKQFIRL